MSHYLKYLKICPASVAYLTAISAERMSKQSRFYRDLPDSSFPTDASLKALIQPKYISLMKSGYRCNAARQVVYDCQYSLRYIETLGVNETRVKERILDITLSVNETRVKERILDILVDYALEI